jgi:hypothetical protein
MPVTVIRRLPRFGARRETWTSTAGWREKRAVRFWSSAAAPGGFDRRPFDYFSGETVVLARF